MVTTLFLAVLPLIHFAASSAPVEEIFVGAYTSDRGSKGIYRLALNTEDGTLTEPLLAVETPNPSFLALDPKRTHLYAVDESDKGAVNAFSVGADLTLTRLNGQSSEGGGPCHVSVSPDGKHVYVANYGTGSAASLPVLEDGSLGQASGVFQNSGGGPDKARQEGPHMHSIYPDIHGQQVYACDLGTDELLVFPSADLKDPKRVKLPPGAGPRHLVQSGNGKFLYIVDEMGNNVSVYEATQKGDLNPLQTLSTLPEGVEHGHSRTAEIVIHPNGKWLYVSNRGLDSIAVYKILRDGRLETVSMVRVTVAEPRSFAIDPSGRWLVESGQSSNSINVLKIDPATGELGPHGKSVTLSSPVCILFAGRR